MLKHSLPQTSFDLSVLCLGVAEFGTNIARDEAFAMLDNFAEAGGNWADSAHIYAAWLPDGWGESEKCLGRWINSRRPQDFFVATKVGHPHLSSMDVSRLSPEDIRADFAQCLTRLQLPIIDLLYLHRDDQSVPVSEIVDALNELLKSGQVRALCASNWSFERIAAANDWARKNGKTGFCLSQPGWSLAEIRGERRGFDRTVQMDDETLQWHRKTNFPVAAYSSQANGFFTYSLPENGEMTPKQKRLHEAYGSERNKTRHQRATQLGREFGRGANEIALSYLWSQSFPAYAIIGPRNAEQLNGSLHAADLSLTIEQIEWLESD